MRRLRARLAATQLRHFSHQPHRLRAGAGTFPRDLVSYAPLDFSWAVRTALRRWRPQLVVLVELELWPNLIWACRQADVPVAIVNGRLSASSASGYARDASVDCQRAAVVYAHRGCQRSVCRRFCRLGARPETVHVTGSMKFDGAETDRQQPTHVTAGCGGRTDG